MGEEKKWRAAVNSNTVGQIDAEAHAMRLEATLTNDGANVFWHELADMLTSRTDNGKNACAAPLTNTVGCRAAGALTDMELFDCDGFREIASVSASNTAGMVRTPLECIFQYATDDNAVDRLARGVLYTEAAARRARAYLCLTLMDRRSLPHRELAALIDTMQTPVTGVEALKIVTDASMWRKPITTVEELIDYAATRMSVN